MGGLHRGIGGPGTRRCMLALICDLREWDAEMMKTMLKIAPAPAPAVLFYLLVLLVLEEGLVV